MNSIGTVERIVMVANAFASDVAGAIAFALCGLLIAAWRDIVRVAKPRLTEIYGKATQVEYRRTTGSDTAWRSSFLLQNQSGYFVDRKVLDRLQITLFVARAFLGTGIVIVISSAVAVFFGFVPSSPYMVLCSILGLTMGIFVEQWFWNLGAERKAQLGPKRGYDMFPDDMIFGEAVEGEETTPDIGPDAHL
jgi:hypothetical protein